MNSKTILKLRSPLVASKHGLSHPTTDGPSRFQKIFKSKKPLHPVAVAVGKLHSEYEPRVAKAYVDVVKQVRDNVDLKALTAAVESGNIHKVMKVINPEQFKPLLEKEFKPLLFEAYHMGSLIGAKQLKGSKVEKISVSKAFTASLNLTNPSAVDYLEEALPQLITEITQEQAEAIQDILLTAMTEGADAATSAREIRDSIGLTQQQAEWVNNFREQLISGEDGDSTPITERRLGATLRNQALAEQNSEDTDLDNVDSLVDNYHSSILNMRSLTIAVTEIHDASIAGQDDIWDKAVDLGYLNPDITTVMWLDVGDDRERDDHVQTALMNADGIGLEDDFDTPIGPVHRPGQSGDAEFDINCFLPGTLVSGEFVSGLKSFYSGEALEIITAGGKRLSVTPNHPIMTRKGFVPAGNLRKGDNLVCDKIKFRGDQDFTGNINIQNRPSLIEKVFEALRDAGGVRTTSGTSRLNLHGDELFVKGEIHQVGADWQLGDNFFVSTFKKKQKSIFVFSNIISTFRTCFSPLKFFFPRSFDSFNRFMGSLSLKSSLFFSHKTPFSPLRFGLITEFNSLVKKKSGKAGIADSALFAKFINSNAGKVSLDKVLRIRRFKFSGHVYDLQSVNGLLSANSIFTSNCRCTVFLQFSDKYGAGGYNNDEEDQDDEEDA